MDTVTQIALGAAVGEATLGRQVGRRAVLWGGFCGLFPDLDVLVPLGDAVRNFTYHRGPSHSLFVLAALTPLMVWLILKLHPGTARHRVRWHALVYAALATHVLLDCFTVYGTQIFWPLATPPVMWSTIFIIDPAYSVPLIAGVLAALLLSRTTSRGHALNAVGLMLSTSYLLFTVAVKQHVDHVVEESLKRQGIVYENTLTVPAPFNTLLWRVLVMDGNGYYEGFYSLLDKSRSVRYTQYPSDRRLLKGLEDHWPVKRLHWFTHGFYAVGQRGPDIVVTDLRMGLEPSYVFRFKVGTAADHRAIPAGSRRIRDEGRLDQLRWVWQRIWTADPAIGGAKKNENGQGGVG